MPTPQIGRLIPGTLPEGWCAQSEQDRYQAYFRLGQVVSLTGQTGQQFFNFGNSTPSADNRVYPWLRTESDGSPDRWYVFFDGLWCSPHETPASDGRLWPFEGTEAEVATLDGGTAGTATTKGGPFWEIATDWAAKMPLGVGTLPVSETVVDVGDEGGTDRVVLKIEELPEAPIKPLGSDGEETDVLTVQQTSTEGDDAQGGRDVTSTDSSGDMSNVTLKIDGSGESHENMPPYKAVYWIRRTIRQFYTQAG